VFNKLKIRITWGFYYLFLMGFLLNILFICCCLGYFFIVFLGVKDYV